MPGLISKMLPHVSIWSTTVIKRATIVTSRITVSEALQNLNQRTLEIYARKKAQTKNQLGKQIPVIIANQNQLLSKYQDIRRDVEYVPKQYHLLKALAHIPIAIYTILSLQDTQEVDRLRDELEGLFRSYQKYPYVA